MANAQLPANNVMEVETGEDATVNLDMDEFLYKQKMIRVCPLIETA